MWFTDFILRSTMALADVAVVDEEVVAMEVRELIFSLAIFSIPVIAIFIVLLVLGKKKKAQRHSEMTSEAGSEGGLSQMSAEKDAAEETHEE